MNGMCENEKKPRQCAHYADLPLQIMSETCYNDIEKRINVDTTVSFKIFN